MGDSLRKRYSRSPSPYEAQARSGSRSSSRSSSRPRERSRSRSRSRPRGRTEAKNSGNGLYVSGLSTRVTERELENHFAKEGKVAFCFLVVEPHTRASRGFAFITMDSVDDAERCIKHLHQSVLDGRGISVERSQGRGQELPHLVTILGQKTPGTTAIVAIVVGTEVVEMTMDTVLPRDAHHIEVVVTIRHLGAHRLMAEGIEGSAQDQYLILRMVALTDIILVARH